MITAWILYAVLVGGLVGGGALALETLLRHHARPSRWIWMGAILLSVAWPSGHWAWENRPPEPVPATPYDAPLAVIQELPHASSPREAVTLQVPQESVLRRLDGPILLGWGVTSGALLCFFGLLSVRTHRMRREWEEGRAGGRRVLYSDEWGPAVVGLLRPRIVLPRWCERMDDGALGLIVEHELEHVRAGDLRLFLLATAVPILLPWHLPVWWQWARLRTAVEGDCDLRVLRKTPGCTRSYVNLLLDVGQRSSRRRALATLLSEPYETLKRRIKLMTMPLPQKIWLRGSLLAGLGAVLIAVACWAPAPTDADYDEVESVVDPTTGAGSASDEPGALVPTFTPYSVLPAVNNREEVVRALEREYPPRLRDAGIGGIVQVWLFVDEEGTVRNSAVNRSSGHQALDEAAFKVAELIDFTPALNRDQPRAVWISLPMEFTTRGDPMEGEVGAARRKTPRQERVAGPPSDPREPLSKETGTVAGRVANAATGHPMAFVQVHLPGTGRGGLTNTDGRFLIPDVPVGERQIVAELVGFGLVSQDVTIVTGQPASANFELRTAAIPLSKLVVRGVRGAGG